MSLQKFRTVDYHVLKTVGKGSCGSVFLVMDSKKRRLAMKQLKKSDTTLQEVLSEVSMLRKIQDVCQDYLVCLMDDVKEDAKHYYVFSEYLEDYLDLATLLEHHDIAPQYKQTICQNLLKCVKFLHSRKICHRDLKPANIMVSPTTLQAKLIDFGFACAEDACPLVSLAGTFTYMHPTLLKRLDILADGVTVNFDATQGLVPADFHKNDLWGTGLTCLAILHGQNPLALHFHHLMALKAFYESPYTKDAAKEFIKMANDEIHALVGERLLLR